MTSSKESWATIQDYPNYLVSDIGRVFSARYDRVIRPRSTQDGYLQVLLINNEGRANHYVHRLVADAFIRRVNREWDVKHLDLDRGNNRVENLELVSAGRTERLRPYSGPHTRGRPVYINELDEVFVNAYAAAEYIDGDPSHIYACLNGRLRSHLGFTFRYIM